MQNPEHDGRSGNARKPSGGLNPKPGRATHIPESSHAPRHPSRFVGFASEARLIGRLSLSTAESRPRAGCSDAAAFRWPCHMEPREPQTMWRPTRHGLGESTADPTSHIAIIAMGRLRAYRQTLAPGPHTNPVESRPGEGDRL